MRYLQKKYSTIDAIQWTGDNTEEVIDFGSIKYDNGEVINFIEEDTYKPDTYRNEEVKKYYETPKLIISGFMYSGDIAYIGDYITFSDGEYIKIPAEEFESKYVKYRGKYRAKYKVEVEAIKWEDDNTEEVLKFIGKDGGLEGTKTQVLIMNNFGGSVLNKGDYVVKQDNDFYSMTDENFKKTFEKYN